MASFSKYRWRAKIAEMAIIREIINLTCSLFIIVSSWGGSHAVGKEYGEGFAV